MKVRITPSTLNGTVKAVDSKSQLHRILICAALSDEQTVINCKDFSEDIYATIKCLEALGVKIETGESFIKVTPFEQPAKNAVLNCGESGSTFRFMLPVAAALGTEASYELAPSLALRPYSEVTEQLKKHGCCILNSPLSVKGRLDGGSFFVSGNVSSQYLSGFLLALPLLDGESSVELTTSLESASYVDMTIDAMKKFGVSVNKNGKVYTAYGAYHPLGNYTPEGDWSQASALLCAGAVSGKVSISGLHMNSMQGDKVCAGILAEMNANIAITWDSVSVIGGALNGTVVDAENNPDIVLYIAAAALHAKTPTEIKNVHRLRFKESDRISSLLSAFGALGGEVCLRGDSIVISPSNLKFAELKCSDHRIAMAAAIASLRYGCVIDGAECVNKSYPAFWQHLKELGADIDEIL